MKKNIFLILFLFVCVSNICAESVRMKVGDTKTLYPYVLIFDAADKGLNTTDTGLTHPFRSYGCAIRPVQER